jgi:hypothetical protein
VSIPTHDQYPGTDPADFNRTITIASLAVAFYDMCKEGQMASSTASLLTNTWLQALMLPPPQPATFGTLDISDALINTDPP